MTEINNEKSEYGLNRGNLKMIALFCMATDHLAVAVMEPLIRTLSHESMIYMGLNVLTITMRLIGRVAFPIFCFFIVEGFIYTRSVLKYMLRLLLLAVLSEAPFDMVLEHSVYTQTYQNVFWTLLTGLITIYTLDGIHKKFKIPEYLKNILSAFTCIAAFLTSQCLNFDYGCIGVLAIILIYLMGERKEDLAIVINILAQIIKIFWLDDKGIMKLLLYFSCIILVTAAMYMSKRYANINSRKMFFGCAALVCLNMFECPVLINVPLFELFNGKKGKNYKWFFYLFYPVHLLICAGISKLAGVY